MLVKKAAYYVMAAGPILLLGLIAINSRTSTSTWQFVEYPQETDHRIKAYIQPVAKAEGLADKGDPAISFETHKTIEEWLSDYRLGLLKEIPPVTTTMDPDTGVYKQIVDARSYLLGRAKRLADTYAKQGEYDKAAEAYADAIELGYIAKYSEFGILTESSAKQAMFIAGIEKILPHISVPEHQHLQARITGLELMQKSFAFVVDHYSVAYQNDLHRLGQPDVLIEASRDTNILASAADPETVRIDRWRAISRADRDLNPLFGTGRLAQTSEQTYEVRLEKLSQELRQPDASLN